MLNFASRREIALPTGERFATPLLVPSFSSKGFAGVRHLLEDLSPLLTHTYLISAYDLFHGEISFPDKLPDLLFIDSGGYESGVDDDLSTPWVPQRASRDWSKESYESQISKTETLTSTMLVSFDHAAHRVPVRQQISEALEIARHNSSFAHELLLKPSAPESTSLALGEIIDCLQYASEFALIGVSERELGRSLTQRMLAIARLRQELERLGSDQAIHVFGSLDPVCSPLYFVSGADVFDGLTWLRYAFDDEVAIYQYSWAASTGRYTMDDAEMRASMLINNIKALTQLSDKMSTYAESRDLELFRNRDIMAEILKSVEI